MELLSSPFKPVFSDFIDSVASSCIVCSPYITAGPIKALVSAAQAKNIADTLDVSVVTNISMQNMAQGATDIDALIYLAQHLNCVRITYLPRIHAKVYVSGDDMAIITSANFTDGGASRNLEYGMRTHDKQAVATIRADITAYAKLGETVLLHNMTALSGEVRELREAVREEQQSIRRKMRSASLERQLEDNLLRIRVQGRSINATFAATILYLLARQQLTTAELNAAVQQIHPDLCDDTMDRVIDGKHFGKLWKHQVRSAQVSLRRQGHIDYDQKRRIWRCTGGGNTP